MKQSLEEILAGSTEKKIEAVEAIWDSINNDNLSVMDEEVQIAKQRYEEYLQNPGEVIDWKEARQKLGLRFIRKRMTQ